MNFYLSTNNINSKDRNDIKVSKQYVSWILLGGSNELQTSLYTDTYPKYPEWAITQQANLLGLWFNRQNGLQWGIHIIAGNFHSLGTDTTFDYHREYPIL